MNSSNRLHTAKSSEIVPFYEKSTFILVSNLLTDFLGGKHQQIMVYAKPGSFIHDQSAGIESTETTRLSIDSGNVVEREKVTEISIEGAIKKVNELSNTFSIFFTMKRQFLVIPKPFTEFDAITETGKIRSDMGINGILYNSIFALNLRCIDKSGCQYPLGTGRGYLIFDKTQKME